jgi:hypothetical protein
VAEDSAAKELAIGKSITFAEGDFEYRISALFVLEHRFTSDLAGIDVVRARAAPADARVRP